MIEDELIRQENEKLRVNTSLAYKRLFETDDGKLVLKDLEKFCHLEDSCVCEQSPDPYQTFHESGKRRVILRINTMRKRESK